MKIRNYELFERQAQLCHTLASAKRLAILELLERRETSVTEIAEALGSSVSAVSQHLRAMRDHNVVACRRDRQTIYYRLKAPRLIKCCHLIRSILLEELKKSGQIAEDFNPETLIEE